MALYSVVGVDLTQIHCMGSYLALMLVGEYGTDMPKWPSTLPLGYVSPQEPKYQMLSSRTRRSKNRVTALLRLAAVNVGKTDSAHVAFYRLLSTRTGKAKQVIRLLGTPTTLLKSTDSQIPMLS